MFYKIQRMLCTYSSNKLDFILSYNELDHFSAPCVVIIVSQL